MNITLPDIATQQAEIFRAGTATAIKQLQENLNAPRIPPQTEVDESLYPRTHLLRKEEGYVSPDKALVRAYFEHFQKHFPEYGTDRKLAQLLGISGDRHIRKFKEGSNVPYGVWRQFLVITGRVPQDVLPVLAFMG